MDEELADLSFLSSHNFGLAENMDVIHAMQMAFQPEPTETNPLVTQAGVSSAAESGVGHPALISAGPAQSSLAPSMSQQTTPASEQVALASASAAGQMTPASVLLDQLLSAPLPDGATPYPLSNPVPTLTGPRIVEPMAAQASVVSNQVPLMPSQVPVVPSQVPVVSSLPAMVPGAVELVTGGPLPVITIGGNRVDAVRPAVVPRRRPPSKVVIVKPKPKSDSASSTTHVGKKVIVVGSKAVPRPGGQQVASPSLLQSRSVVPAPRLLPRLASGSPASSAAQPAPPPTVVQKIALSGVRAQVVMVGGKERIVLYRQQPTGEAGTAASSAAVATAAALASSVTDAPAGSVTSMASSSADGGFARTAAVSLVTTTAAADAVLTIAGAGFSTGTGSSIGQGTPSVLMQTCTDIVVPTFSIPAVMPMRRILPAKISEKSDIGDVDKSAVNSAAKSTAKSATKSATESDDKTATKSTVTITTKSSHKSKPAFKPAAKSATKPAAKPASETTTEHTPVPAAESATKPERKLFSDGLPPPGRIINVRIANGCVTATRAPAPAAMTTAAVSAVWADRRPAVRVLQPRAQRAAEPLGLPVHSFRPPPPPPSPAKDDMIIVDDRPLPAMQRGERTAVPAARRDPAAKPPPPPPPPPPVVATSLVAEPSGDGVRREQAAAKQPESVTTKRPNTSVDQALQQAVSAIFDCVDETAESRGTADQMIDGLLRHVERGGVEKEAWRAAQAPLLAEVLQRTSAEDPESSQTSTSSQGDPSEPPPTADGAVAAAGGEDTTRPGARQRRRKDVLRPLLRFAEPVPAPPDPSPPTLPPTLPPLDVPPPAVPPRPASLSPSPERKPITDTKTLAALVEDMCTVDGLSWSRTGFADISRKKRKKEELDTKEAELYLNEFGLLEVVDKADHEALVLERPLLPCEDSPASGGGGGGGINRRPDSICCCSVCGCFGCLADFFDDGAFCSKVCFDVSAGRAAIKKKKIDFIERKKRKLADVDEDKYKELIKGEPVKKVAPPKDTQRLVYGGNSSFSWSRYLDSLSRLIPAACAAPEPTTSETPATMLFRPGQWLEAVDPRDPTIVCVCSVAEVTGTRLRLHFDGYSVRFDFWVESDSRDIFPCGWTERQRATESGLQLPPGRRHAPFVWREYLRERRAVSAPDAAFKCVADQEKPFQRVETELRVGQRLEAADPAHPQHIRPARVAQIRAGRVLVLFDGAARGSPGYWTDLSSPRLRPVAWAEENGVTILPPDDWGEWPFRWQAHLVRTRSLPVPARLFRTRAPVTLLPAMRVEAVDVRVPALMRVMHVVEVSRHGLVRLRSDGWRAAQDQWLPLDGGGLHAPGWCRRVGHPLTPPVTRRQAAGGCRTAGCAGLGHAGGPRYRRHDTTAECPYRGQRSATPDRIGSGLAEEDDLRSLEWHVPAPPPPTPPTPPAPPAPPALPAAPAAPAVTSGGVRRCITLCRDISSIASEVTSVVFDKETPSDDRRAVWPRCERLRAVDRFLAENRAVHLWGADTVVQFLRQFSAPGADDAPLQTFAEEEIDGEALLLLTRDDLCSMMNIRLGTATKVHNCIVRLRKHFNYRGQTVKAPTSVSA